MCACSTEYKEKGLSHLGIITNKKRILKLQGGGDVCLLCFLSKRLRLKTYGFLHRTNFCLFFPCAPSRSMPIQLRGAHEKFCSKSDQPFARNIRIETKRTRFLVKNRVLFRFLKQKRSCVSILNETVSFVNYSCQFLLRRTFFSYSSISS